MFHSLNAPLIATFCEACQALLLQMKIVFQKSGPLKRRSFRRNGVRMSLLGTRLVLWVVGRTRREIPGMARSSGTLALEAISCKIYRHCRNINGAGRELELVALTKTNLSA